MANQQMFPTKNTKQIILEMIARGSPYYPFSSFSLSGEYGYKEDGQVIRLWEQKSGWVESTEKDGAELLIEVADGWYATVLVRDDPFWGSPNEQTLFMKGGDHLYIDTHNNSVAFMRASVAEQGDFQWNTIEGSYLDFEILGVGTTDLPDTEAQPISPQQLGDYTENMDDGEQVTITEYREMDESGDYGSGAVSPPPPPSTDSNFTDWGFVGVIGVGIIMWLIYGTLIRRMA